MATTEEQVLKTLQNIEKLMKGSSALAGGANTNTGISQTSSVTAKRANTTQDRAMKQSMIATTKILDRFGDSTNRGTVSMTRFAKQTDSGSSGLKTFTGELGKTITQFTTARAELSKISLSSTMDNLEKAVQSAADTIKNTQVGRVNTVQLSERLQQLDDLVHTRINPRFNVMKLNLRAANTAIDEFRAKLSSARSGEASDLKAFGKGLGVVVSSISRQGGIGTQFARMELLMKGVNAQLRAARGNLRRGGGGGSGGGGGGGGSGSTPGGGGGDEPKDAETKSFMARAMGGLAKRWKVAVGFLASTVAHNATKVVEDMFEVTGARGFGTFESITTLYKNAAMAGMSLREYAQILDQNMGLVSRSTSFAEFDKQLDVGRESLAKFGVFGADATKLSATMASSAQTLGVPMKDLSGSMTGQMRVFEDLRKTTGLTADAFGELITQLRDSEVVQKELLGLAPRERAARFEQIAKTTSWGKQLGLSESAQRALTESILAQRKSTVKERFQQRGRLTQAFSLVGMSPDKIARVQALASKRNKTTEETQEYTRLLGEYSQRAEQLKQTGGPGMQFQIEAMDEKLGEAGLTQQLDAAGQVRAAEQSGTQQNQDPNKTLNVFEQTLGKMWTAIEGLAKNPAVLAGIGLAGAALTFLASVAYLRIQAGMIGEAVARSIGLGGAGGGAGGGIGGGKAGKGGLGRTLLKGAGILGAVASVGMAGKAYMDAENAEDPGKAKGEAIGTAAGGAIGAAIGLALTPLTGGLSNLVAGPLGSLLGGWVGGLIGEKSSPTITPLNSGSTVPGAVIAAPIATTPTSVTPAAVNTAASTIASTTPNPLVAAQSQAALPVQDASSTLQQILAVLQQSLNVENQQVDLTTQLLRSPAFQARLPDNQYMVQRALAQT